MKYTPFKDFEKAEALRQEANQLVNQLELLARHGVERADSLMFKAWDRYTRRMKAAHALHDITWGAL